MHKINIKKMYTWNIGSFWNSVNYWFIIGVFYSWIQLNTVLQFLQFSIFPSNETNTTEEEHIHRHTHTKEEVNKGIKIQIKSSDFSFLLLNYSYNH